MQARSHRSGSSVLIETSWNVKAEIPAVCVSLVRINRNIVECKEYVMFLERLVSSVLIETSWNVKEAESVLLWSLASY